MHMWIIIFISSKGGLPQGDWTQASQTNTNINDTWSPTERNGSALSSQFGYWQRVTYGLSHATVSSVSCLSQLFFTRHDKDPRRVFKLRVGDCNLVILAWLLHLECLWLRCCDNIMYGCVPIHVWLKSKMSLIQPINVGVKIGSPL